ncbi:MAG: carboxypeptidase M32 [Deinococcales bacterium]
MQTLQELKNLLGEISDLTAIGQLVSWDRETQMPKGAAASRATQLATMARLLHEKNTAPRLRELLLALEPSLSNEDSLDGALIRLLRLDMDRKSKLPSDFVAEFAAAKSLSGSVWEAARHQNDWAAFLPHLQKMFDYARRAADLYGFDSHPYDALLPDYDPGLKTADIKTIFADVRTFTVPLLEKIKAAGENVDYSILTRHYPIAAQRAFGLEVAQAFGYDLHHGRLDVAAHPFATSFSKDDVRITTRFDEHYFPMAFYGMLHEAGHAMYEQNTADELRRTPLARGAWSTVHESQSRLWENLVGRSNGFWQFWFERAQKHFPAALHDVDAATMYRLVNRVRPSLIRVEADELTYNLHIMLRFELELAVFEEKLKVAQLPEAWNAKMQEYLGITPPDYASGVMQDIHWSAAMFAYFPTYSLGNILSVQLFEKASAQMGDLDAMFARGEYQPLLHWLRHAVLRYGKTYLPPELIVQATGKPLNAAPYLGYLERKFSGLYGLHSLE